MRHPKGYILPHIPNYFRFKTLQKSFGKTKGLKQPVKTRWYTQYNCVNSLLVNKLVMKALLDEEVSDNFKDTIGSDSFWGSLKCFGQILEYPTNLIGKMESDGTDLSRVYQAFQNLMDSYAAMKNVDNLVLKSVRDMLLRRWEFIHTESMGMAFVLNPYNIEVGMIGTDRVDSIQQLRKHIDQVYESDAEDCKGELIKFNSFFHTCSDEQRDAIIGVNPLEFWSMFGCNEYRLLGKSR